MRAKEVNKETATWLLNLANDMRRAKEDQLLNDLPLSIPNNSENCIIANAFNYGCQVEPGNGGFITFQTIEDRNTYLKVMGMEWSPEEYECDCTEDYFCGCEDKEDTITVTYNGVNLGSYYYANAPMTEELVKIAEDFDEGLLFEEYDMLKEEV